MGRALELVKKLKTVEFNWKHNNQHDIGLIAEEVEKVFPEAVYYKDGKVEGIKVMPIIALLIEAIKELGG